MSPGIPGRILDERAPAETGFSFRRAREHTPTLGRYLSTDTVQPNAPGTQGYNLYAYVQNNPTTWADPSGHAAVDTVLWDAIYSEALFFEGEGHLTCGPVLDETMSIVEEGAELLLLPGEMLVGAFTALIGAIGVLLTLIACAIEILPFTDSSGHVLYAGCGGLALDPANEVNHRPSRGQFESGHSLLPLPPAERSTRRGAEGPTPLGVCRRPSPRRISIRSRSTASTIPPPAYLSRADSK